MPKDARNGQILLITLLVMAIAVTIALSLIGRSSTDVAISNQVAESARAFSAAEAGIEQALITGAGSGGVPITIGQGVSFLVDDPVQYGGGTSIVMYPRKTAQGESETVWLVPHQGDQLDEADPYRGSFVDVCWSDESPTEAAVAVSVVYRSAADNRIKVARSAFDPNGARSNNFDTAITSSASDCDNTRTMHRSRITFASFTPAINVLSDTLIAIRVMPIYADAWIAVRPETDLPVQGVQYTSTGTTGSGVNSRITVSAFYRVPSSIFDYVLYSQEGSLVQ